MTTYEDLPPFLLGFPGPLRDQLVAAVLSGMKTATTGLFPEYEAEGEPLPVPGERGLLLDSAERAVAVVEVTDVRVVRLAEVDLRHALDEGEGYASVAEWRTSHERFWHSAPVREALGDPEYTVDDDTLVVMERFRVLTRLPAS
ncbi:ASCH domain protein [Streptomyces sp. ADI95-16]|uniref:ASCH domain-containing protein n=1 Tax=Streptomyces sp. ADI95-16 TaxID=1522758 RepID=UPI000F3A7FE6|nr:ASCH domain-containing protein [Streptomyces sp. ADI95-16]AYV26931.1 ASCH domain protein [Streptomyces sp. ADI95-16]